MEYSIALSHTIHAELIKHLIRQDEQEDLCFAVWYPSKGANRQSSLIHEIILPQEGDREIHGNVSFNPQYFDRALTIARRAGGGLAFLHSHPFPGWQGMSKDDIIAETRLAPTVFGATGLPLVGMTIGNDESWSGRMWQRSGKRVYDRQWCTNVRVVGPKLSVTFNDSLIRPPRFRNKLKRTISAWGNEAQQNLARLKVGVIGTGSVGTLVAESLARMGIANITLLDFDHIEEHNLGTLLHASVRDVGKIKVEHLAKCLKRSSTSSPFSVTPHSLNITKEEGFRVALDCDVLFSCVDRPWPKQVLNFMAYVHLIPVVDGGLIAEITKNGSALKRADWRAHGISPGRICMECLGQVKPSDVSLERSGLLDDPEYIKGISEGDSLKRNENVFGFSMATASLEVLQFLKMTIPSPGLSHYGAQMYHFVSGNIENNMQKCSENCLYSKLIGQGDHCEFKVVE